MNKNLSLTFACIGLLALTGCSWKRKKNESTKTEIATLETESQWEAVDAEKTLTEDLNEDENISRKNIFADEDPIEEEVESITFNPLTSKNAPDSEKTESISSKQKIETIYFDFDKYELRKDQTNKIQKTVQALKTGLKKDPSLTIVVEGHACAFAGSHQYNLFISDHRAGIIKKYLIKNGIPANKIEAFGLGTERLVVPFGDREEQAPNRRTEIYFYRAA